MVYFNYDSIRTYTKIGKGGTTVKLREIILKNFRGYYVETRITIDDLTALIGKNDVGKSTILEALDIFFNQSKLTHYFNL